MSELLTWGSIAGALVIIVTALRLFAPVRRRIVTFVRRIERANDVVLGAPAIPDPDRPGELLRPAIPDIGVRMTKTETLLEQFVVGAVEEAKTAASTAAAAAIAAQAAADEARSRSFDTHARFDALTEKVDEMSVQITTWQEADRTRGDAAVGVLQEVVRTIPPRPGERY